MDSLFGNIVSAEFWAPVQLSIKVAILSSVFIILFGTITGRLMSRVSFRGKAAVETLIMLPLVLPPTVVGFLLIIIFGRYSFIGQGIERLFEQPVIFTWWAAVIASIVVAFPLMYQTAKSGFADIDPEIEDAGRVDGGKERQIFLYLSIPLAARSLLSGSVLSFARALGEFGATFMFAGNIPGQTQTIPTAIYVAIDSGNMNLAWLFAGTIMLISFLMLLFVQLKKW